jgi:membrane-associated phospholipid phosphatase
MNVIDTSVLHTLYALRDPTVAQAFMWITELGSTLMIGGISLCVGLLLIVREKISYFLGLSITIAGTGAVVFILKEIFGRARPDALYQAYAETGFAFPSGHAALSLALYGFLAYLAWKYYSRKPALLVISLMTLIVGLIGFSRLYLGLHYASDVIAGYAIAAIFLTLGTAIANKLSRSPIWS